MSTKPEFIPPDAISGQALQTANDIFRAINTALETHCPEKGPCFKESMRDKIAAGLETVLRSVVEQHVSEAMELGQKNCDEVYDDLKRELTETRQRAEKAETSEKIAIKKKRDARGSLAEKIDIIDNLKAQVAHLEGERNNWRVSSVCRDLQTQLTALQSREEQLVVALKMCQKSFKYWDGGDTTSAHFFQLHDCKDAVNAALASSPIPDSHPEERCEDCGRRNITWFVNSPLWNRVMRNGEREPIICPSCFAIRAEAVGVNPSAWELTEPQIPATKPVGEELSREEIENKSDNLWLSIIANNWKRVTGQSWDDMDGEFREDGIEANVQVVFRLIESERAKTNRATRFLTIAADAIETALSGLNKLSDGIRSQLIGQQKVVEDGLRELTSGGCNVPPAGWYCTRAKGHDGPCAAIPMKEVPKPSEDLSAGRGGWQSIESAPKNRGKHLRMFGDGQGFEDCEFIGMFWDDGKWVETFSLRPARPRFWQPCGPEPTNPPEAGEVKAGENAELKGGTP